MTLNVLEALPLVVVTVTVPEPTAAVAATLTDMVIEVVETVAALMETPELLKLRPLQHR